MVSRKSFSEIINSERERRILYNKASKTAEDKICSCCKQRVINNGGPSRVDDICNNCVSKSMRDNN